MLHWFSRLVVVVGLVSLSSIDLHGDFWGLDIHEQIRLQQVLFELQKLSEKIDQFSAQQGAQKTGITIHNHGPADHATLYVVQNATGQNADQVSGQNKKADGTIEKNNAVAGALLGGGAGQPPLAPRPSWWQRIKSFAWGKKQRGDGGQPGDESFWDYLNNHKKEIVVQGALIGYVYVNYRLFSLNSYLQSTERWHFWHSDKVLAQLLALPQKEVARELVYEIKRRYVSYGGQDQSEPFIQFMKAIEEEIEAFNSYLTLTNVLTKIELFERHCVSYFGRFIPRQFSPITNFVFDFIMSKISIRSAFPFLDEQLIASAQESLSRLVFLRSCFAQWLAELKLLAIDIGEKRAQPGVV